MRRFVIVILTVLILVACWDSKRNDAITLLQEWVGKTIVFPTNIFFVIQGKDTVEYHIRDTYKILTYIDPVGCTSCKLRLREWKVLMNDIDSVALDSIQFLFFFSPKKDRDIYKALKMDNFHYPVCVDKLDSLNKLNHFPSDVAFQTFLLDKNNKVVAIGNPIHNPKVKKLYLDIIQGKTTMKAKEPISTKIQTKELTISLGNFNWQEEQKANFVIHNVGKHPLVINDVTTSCGCTSVEYTKEPVCPGDSIALQVTYKADNPEHFNKTITVYCNTNPSLIHLKIVGDAE